MPEPTEEQVAQWKQASDVYAVNLTNVTYYYRPINRAEFRNVMKVVNQPTTTMVPNPEINFQVEELTIQIAVLHPKITPQSVLGMPAGVVSKLSDLVMESSGFDSAATPELI